MEEPKITYIIHIAATAEEVWEAITNSESLRKNWGRIESRWTVGSEVAERSGSGKVLWKGEVLKSQPPHLLVYTFEMPGTPRTEVNFEIGPPVSPVAPGASVVRLAVSQIGFAKEDAPFHECARAWTEILSSFKTYVETGRSLGFLWEH
jgi:uncharacterized protein YndB with AHSA1/START domain